MAQFAVSGQHYLFNVQTFASVVLSNGGDAYDYALRDRTTRGVIDDVASGASELGVLVETTTTADDLEAAFTEACAKPLAGGARTKALEDLHERLGSISIFENCTTSLIRIAAA
jgi:hypothetical protein